SRRHCRMAEPSLRSLLQHQPPAGLGRSRTDIERAFSVMHKVIGVAGFKNAGKTTLVEKLVAELARRGFSISTVKHAHHSFDIDHEGRDSFRHRKAGATEVAVVSANRWAIIHELRKEEEPRLADVLAKMAACDLVIVEGYK